MRRGATVLELATALAVLALVLLVALPTVGRWRDRLAAERAALEIAAFYQRARFAAIYRGTTVRLEFAADSLRATYEGATDSTFLAVAGPARHGVGLRTSRPMIRLLPTGVGWGLANTKLVLTRGAAAESLTTSRLGRIRRW